MFHNHTKNRIACAAAESCKNISSGDCIIVFKT